ncbi:MAG: hypothetical protein E5W99_11515 [Mesorhizobium sp.]|nr:MAG: hypothetical protein E5W99_11515 [Mesorhizobium sp.]
MSEGSEGLHKEGQRIERAQPPCPRHVLDCDVRVVMAGLEAAAGAPGGCAVRVEHERAVGQCRSGLVIAGDITQRQAAESQRHRIVLAGDSHVADQPGYLGCFLLPVDHPAIRHAPEIAPGGSAFRGGKIGVELDGPVELWQRLLQPFSRPAVKARHAAQIVVIGVEALGGLALGARHLGLFESG